ncbi:metallophosphoesterase [Candidatus Woesearchaeota archaeon]|nr:metallophosphoesterase [Candidatus Woesearchaeota archaeon]
MAFKIVYSADLHGNFEFYSRLLKKAEQSNANAIVIGGDLCGREGSSLNEKIENQKLFLEKLLILINKFKKKNKGKELYIIMGNDDFRKSLDVLEKADKAGILKSIHKKSIKLNKNFSICGYSFINPTPFRLKDWEKPDFSDGNDPIQLFNEEVRSVPKEEGTIEEDLSRLRKLSDPKSTVYAIHAPPFNTKLDMIATGTHVGSRAVRKFIEEEQPLLTLHGHIHESPMISGSWKDNIGKTICINVGSSYPKDRLNCVIIDLKNLNGIQYYELK